MKVYVTAAQVRAAKALLRRGKDSRALRLIAAAKPGL